MKNSGCFVDLAFNLAMNQKFLRIQLTLEVETKGTQQSIDCRREVSTVSAGCYWKFIERNCYFNSKQQRLLYSWVKRYKSRRVSGIGLITKKTATQGTNIEEESYSSRIETIIA